MKQKLYYTILACLCSLTNIALINTRFNIVGLGFGILAGINIIKAIRTKQ